MQLHLQACFHTVKTPCASPRTSACTFPTRKACHLLLALLVGQRGQAALQMTGPALQVASMAAQGHELSFERASLLPRAMQLSCVGLCKLHCGLLEAQARPLLVAQERGLLTLQLGKLIAQLAVTALQLLPRSHLRI